MSGVELPEVERAVVYTPIPGDRVVLEVGEYTRPDQVERLKEQAEAAFGLDVKVIVLAGVRFHSVVRP